MTPEMRGAAAARLPDNPAKALKTKRMSRVGRDALAHGRFHAARCGEHVVDWETVGAWPGQVVHDHCWKCDHFGPISRSEQLCGQCLEEQRS
jgi:hypothetical protein